MPSYPQRAHSVSNVGVCPFLQVSTCEIRLQESPWRVHGSMGQEYNKGVAGQ